MGIGPKSLTSIPADTNPASRADSNIYPDILVSFPMRTVPPSGAKICAEALAKRSANSAVIGDSPTRPRIPSVPKYFISLSHIQIRAYIIKFMTIRVSEGP